MDEQLEQLDMRYNGSLGRMDEVINLGIGRHTGMFLWNILSYPRYRFVVAPSVESALKDDLLAVKRKRDER